MRLLLLFLTILVLTQKGMTQMAVADEAAIRETVMNYIEGRNTGDSVRLKKAFHSDAVLKSIDPAGKLAVWPAPDYIKRMSTGKKQDCTAAIESITYFNDAAQATVVINYPTVTFYDYLNLLRFQNQWVITDKVFSRKPAAKKVLFVVTSHSKDVSTGNRTGLYLKEVSQVYKTLQEAGYEIDFVSPGAGVNYMYGSDINDNINAWFVQNKKAYQQLMAPKRPDAIQASQYRAIYFAGGHGAMWDFPANAQIASIAAKIYEANGVVGAICHGVAGLLNIKLSSNEYLVKDKQLTSFSNEEEKEIKLDKAVPFLLETELQKKGAHYKSDKNWSSFVLQDQRVITGQNAQSVGLFAERFLKALAELK